MKCSLGISNFLEEISSLSHSVVFLCFFALIAEEGFLISPCYSLDGRDWGQEEKGMTEDEMAGWHHQLDGHGFGWTPGFGDGQGGLACCSPLGHKESDMTE